MKPTFFSIAGVIAIIAWLSGYPSLVIGQQAQLDSLSIDESKGELHLFGTFGKLAPTVWVNAQSLLIKEYDTCHILCLIPNSGKGSYGPVTVLCGFTLTNYHFITFWEVHYEYDDAVRHNHGPVTYEGREYKSDLYFRFDLTNCLSQGDTTNHFIHLLPYSHIRNAWFKQHEDITTWREYTDISGYPLPKGAIINTRNMTVSMPDLVSPGNAGIIFHLDSNYNIKYEDHGGGSSILSSTLWYGTVFFPPNDSIINANRNTYSSVKREENSGINISCYPNPATSFTTLRWSNDQIGFITIRDVVGRTLAEYQVRNGTKSISLPLHNYPKLLLITATTNTRQAYTIRLLRSRKE